MFFPRVAVTAFTSRAAARTTSSNAFRFAKGTHHRFAAATGSSSHLLFSTDVKVPPAPTSNHAHTKLANAQGSIIYTETDEAPALATFSLYPAVAKVC